MGGSRKPSRGFLLGWKRACPRQRVPGSAAARATLGVLGATVPGTGHRPPGWVAVGSGRQQPGPPGWRRGGGEPGQGWHGGSPRAARREQGRWQRRCPPRRAPGEGGGRIALCRFMWKLERLGCRGGRGGMTIGIEKKRSFSASLLPARAGAWCSRISPANPRSCATSQSSSWSRHCHLGGDGPGSVGTVPRGGKRSQFG